MIKLAIIIPSRLDAQRLPNKPLKLINEKEMILHVYNAAASSKAGEVYVATPDQKIVDIVKNAGGNVVKTSDKHETGTDRIFEVFKNNLDKSPNIIINYACIRFSPIIKTSLKPNIVPIFTSINKCNGYGKE